MGGQIGWVDGWVVGPKRSPETTEQQVNFWRRIKKSFVGSQGEDNRMGKPHEWGRSEQTGWEMKEGRKSAQECSGKTVCMECTSLEFLDAVNPGIQGMGSWSKWRASAVRYQHRNWSDPQETRCPMWTPSFLQFGRDQESNLTSCLSKVLTVALTLMSGVWPELGWTAGILQSQHPSFLSHGGCTPTPLSPISPPINLSRSNGIMDRRWKACSIFWSSDKRLILVRRWQKKLDHLAYAWGWGGGRGGWDQPQGLSWKALGMF